MENSIKMKSSRIILLFILFLGTNVFAQREQINWISFEQLDDSLSIKPKKVFISFYADWCSYCKKMDQVVFQNSEIISILNSHYYAVKMNTETRDTIVFEGKKFYNHEAGKRRNPVHEIPLLLASRKKVPFSLPATIILDESFQIKKRYFEYIPPKKMLRILTRQR